MVEQKITVGVGTEWPLDGLLTLPDGDGPFPAVVLVHGSGSSDMDSKIYKVKPFKDIAEGLAQRGVAAIRYDKRSFRYGRKLLKAKGSQFTVWDESIEDALFAAEILRGDKRIDTDRIFVAGLSLGGMLAPRIVAASKGAFAGMVIMAGSPRRLEDIMKEQLMSGLDNYKGVLRWIVKRQVAKFEPLMEGIDELSDEEAQATKFMGGTTLHYLKDMGKPPTEELLKSTDAPMLILQSGNDLQVSKERDFDKYKEILAGRPNATFKLYEGLNHTFMTAHYSDISGAIKEFKIEQQVKDYVIDDIASWIKSPGQTLESTPET